MVFGGGVGCVVVGCVGVLLVLVVVALCLLFYDVVVYCLVVGSVLWVAWWGVVFVVCFCRLWLVRFLAFRFFWCVSSLSRSRVFFGFFFWCFGGFWWIRWWGGCPFCFFFCFCLFCACLFFVLIGFLGWSRDTFLSPVCWVSCVVSWWLCIFVL